MEGIKSRSDTVEETINEIETREEEYKEAEAQRLILCTQLTGLGSGDRHSSRGSRKQLFPPHRQQHCFPVTRNIDPGAEQLQRLELLGTRECHIQI